MLPGIDFLQPSRLAAQPAEVKQSCAPHLRRPHLLDLVNHFAVERKNSLDSLAEAHLAHRKAALRAVLLGDHHALKCLEPLLIAFLDPHLDTNRVARPKGGQIGPVQFLGKTLHHWMNRHNLTHFSRDLRISSLQEFHAQWATRAFWVLLKLASDSIVLHPPSTPLPM